MKFFLVKQTAISTFCSKSIQRKMQLRSCIDNFSRNEKKKERSSQKRWKKQLRQRQRKGKRNDDRQTVSIEWRSLARVALLVYEAQIYSFEQLIFARRLSPSPNRFESALFSFIFNSILIICMIFSCSLFASRSVHIRFRFVFIRIHLLAPSKQSKKWWQKTNSKRARWEIINALSEI